MYKPRQYFDLCYDKANSTIYVIGGYHEEQGVLSSCEKFCLQTYRFTRIRSLKQERLNWTSALIDSKYVYAFNGVGKHGALDTIERYWIRLNFWEKLDIKTPFKMHNNFAWAVNSNDIILLGGIRNYRDGENDKSEILPKVFVFKTKEMKVKELPKLSFNYKISNVFYNNEGRFLWYVPETKRYLDL